jgi:hypothetical protein
MLYPFLPGEYDGLAVQLSTTVQLFGAAGLLLVPIGALWLVNDLRRQAQKKRNLPFTDRGYVFAIAALITGSILATLVSLFVGFGISKAMSVLAFALWFSTVYRWLPGLKLVKKMEAVTIHPAPFYLMIIPLTMLIFQIVFAAPLTNFSRNHAIANSSEYIRDIVAYHDKYGRYPVSLAAMWKDYYPDVVGIEKYHYSPDGESYNLFFEQPRFLFDNLGTREWVVYNPTDEHRIYSHTSWFLLLTPEELERSQGWYAVHDASIPHWRYFWFD